MGRLSLDGIGETFTRRLAAGLSRRSAIARLGAAVAAPVVPVLPVARASAETPSAFARNAQSADPAKCDYWRYCALDGLLCSCCGGGVHTCPPGTQASPTSWIGTCRNPDDGKSYLIAYRDCCGSAPCHSKCFCDGTERETPLYRPQGDNDVIWCFGLTTMAYHCSTAAMVGLAE
ncbi:MAG TPA: methylamine dehydrogenase light chain [Caulobacteraceae bacterium]|jgi:methylamine dehydrogenase light chain|nr:methylamine dehydrogenase light chain [Caulobacteraceae bacterium]